jgi:hypothetical protein
MRRFPIGIDDLVTEMARTRGRRPEIAAEDLGNVHAGA